MGKPDKPKMIGMDWLEPALFLAWSNCPYLFTIYSKNKIIVHNTMQMSCPSNLLLLTSIFANWYGQFDQALFHEGFSHIAGMVRVWARFGLN